MTHIVGKLDGVLRGIAEHRNQATSAATDPAHQPPTSLQQRINNVRNGSLVPDGEEAGPEVELVVENGAGTTSVVSV